MSQLQKDTLLAILLNSTWAVLLIEYIYFKFNVAFPLACIWGICTMIVNIRILVRYAIKIEYKEVK